MLVIFSSHDSKLPSDKSGHGRPTWESDLTWVLSQSALVFFDLAFNFTAIYGIYINKLFQRLYIHAYCLQMTNPWWRSMVPNVTSLVKTPQVFNPNNRSIVVENFATEMLYDVPWQPTVVCFAVQVGVRWKPQRKECVKFTSQTYPGISPSLLYL